MEDVRSGIPGARAVPGAPERGRRAGGAGRVGTDLPALLKAGAASGLAGGVLMASWATVYAAGVGAGFLFPLRLVGSAIFGERALVMGAMGPLTALLVHLVLSAAFGVPFAAAIGRYARATTAVPAGILYGLLLFFVMTAAVLPALNAEVAAEARHVPSSWLVGHVLFGIGVASAPALRRRALAQRARAPRGEQS
jgi:hypothetical protein